MEGLNELEQAVLRKLLSGDHPVLAALRVQAEKARLRDREFSGVGFFCMFELPVEAPILDDRARFEISDVDGHVEGLEHGAGFVLFIRDGRIDMLEGFTYDEPWPRTIGKFELFYHREPRELRLPRPPPPAM